jgi:hypothetical protein
MFSISLENPNNLTLLPEKCSPKKHQREQLHQCMHAFLNPQAQFYSKTNGIRRANTQTLKQNPMCRWIQRVGRKEGSKDDAAEVSK